MAQPHKHARLIKAWADGETIQYWSDRSGIWKDVFENTPIWDDTTMYRVKPSDPEIEEGQIWVRGGIPYIFAQVDDQKFALVQIVGKGNRFTNPIFCGRTNNGLVQSDAKKVFGGSTSEFILAPKHKIVFEGE